MDTPAGSVDGSSFSIATPTAKAHSFSLGGSGRSAKSEKSGEPRKPLKSLLGSGSKKKKAPGSGGEGEVSRSEVALLRNELREKDARLHELEKSFQETKLKAEDWKEYSNMQRFKAEVLVDMWVLRMVNGDGELETLPVDLRPAT